jgi:hypothetical protein
LPSDENAQQPRLQVGRHIADLIEEQSPALSLLEASTPHVLSAGKRPPLMAEQLGLQQLLRDRRGIDGDEWLGRARTVPMQGTRDQLLAGPGLAVDQHGGVRLRKAADRTKHLLHRRGLTQNVRARLRHFGDIVLPQALFHCAPNQIDGVIDIERLGQIFERTALKRGDRAFQIGVSGHDDDGQIGVALFDLLQQLQTRAAGHANVAHDHLRDRGSER